MTSLDASPLAVQTSISRQAHQAATGEQPIVSMTFRAMATDVNVQVVDPSPDAGRLMDAAAAVFSRVEAACTRFDPNSPLMQANAAGDAWHAVPQECFDAISEAATAHRITGGVFDPRVLDTLVGLGYDRTLPFATERVELPAPARMPQTGTHPDDLPQLTAISSPAAGAHRTPRARRIRPWTPGLDSASHSVRIGPQRIDLGGIGKGLAVRWASEALAGVGAAHLVEAGGDCYLSGTGPLRSGWRVGVEDPDGDGTGEPVAVLELADRGCATSSLRVRSWRQGGRRVHHLIDPATGRSCISGLRSVTVAGPDTALAEVWSKALLIAGEQEIAARAHDRELAALWVGDDGQLGMSEAMHRHVIWTARR